MTLKGVVEFFHVIVVAYPFGSVVRDGRNAVAFVHGFDVGTGVVSSGVLVVGRSDVMDEFVGELEFCVLR